MLVTRPIDQALDWVAKLRSRGLDAAALPLMGIGPVADAEPVRQIWRDLSRIDLLMFVSPNAVQHFFAQRPAGAEWPTSLMAASPGPGTTAALISALIAAGVPAAAVIEPPAQAARFDSEALWAELKAARTWQGATVQVLRGSVDDTPEGSGRDWLAQQWREAGAHVAMQAVYRREPPRFDAAQGLLWQQALAEPAKHLWLFSSSEAIDHAQALGAAPSPSLAGGATAASRWSASTALATHPRIAERAREVGFAEVLQTVPTLDAIVAAITSAIRTGGSPRP